MGTLEKNNLWLPIRLITGGILVISVFMTLMVLLVSHYDPSNQLFNQVLVKASTDERYSTKVYVKEKEFRDLIFINVNNALLLDSLRRVRLSKKEEIEYLKYRIITATDELKKNIIEDNYLVGDFFDYGDTKNEYLSFYEILGIKVRFSINSDKFKDLVKENFELDKLREIIGYGDFVNKEYQLIRKFRIDALAIILLGILSFGVLWYYSGRLLKPKTSVKTPEESKQLKERSKIKKEVDLAQAALTEVDDERLFSLYEELGNKIKKLENKEEVTILFSIRKHILLKCTQLYNRSNLMLILGLIVAIIGMVVFYFSLPNYMSGNFNEYLLLSIRPIFVLIFIEGISVYLLKQQRVSMKDHAHFYNLYLKKNDQILITSFLLKGHLNDKEKELLIDVISKNSYKDLEEEEIKNVDKNDMVLIEKILNKIG